jgi:nitrite reductase (NADH) small subunit
MSAAKEMNMEHAVAVCTSDKVQAGVGVAALVNGKQVAIFRLRDGSLHGVSNFDPFSQANVLSRGITGSLQGRAVVASPVYKQHFDLLTGACIEDESVTIATFAVIERDGEVLVIGD